MAQRHPYLKSLSKIVEDVEDLAEKVGTSDLHSILNEEISPLDTPVEVGEMPVEVREDMVQNAEKSQTSWQKLMSLVKHGLRDIAGHLGVKISVTLEKSASTAEKSVTTSKRTNVEGTPMSARTLVVPLVFSFKSKSLAEKSATSMKESASIPLNSMISTEKSLTSRQPHENPEPMVTDNNPEPPTPTSDDMSMYKRWPKHRSNEIPSSGWYGETEGFEEKKEQEEHGEKINSSTPLGFRACIL